MQNETLTVLMDRSSLAIDQDDLMLLECFHPSPYVRQAASELNWNLVMYNRFKRKKEDYDKSQNDLRKN